LKPNCLGSNFDRIICYGTGICTGDKEINDINALRLGNVEQRHVSRLAESCLLAGVDWDYSAAMMN
jgi:hypothetical protein